MFLCFIRKVKKICMAFPAACMSIAAFGALHAVQTARADEPQASDYLTEVIAPARHVQLSADTGAAVGRSCWKIDAT